MEAPSVLSVQRPASNVSRLTAALAHRGALTAQAVGRWRELVQRTGQDEEFSALRPVNAWYSYRFTILLVPYHHRYAIANEKRRLQSPG